MLTPDEIRRFVAEHPDPEDWPPEVRGYVLGAMTTPVVDGQALRAVTARQRHPGRVVARRLAVFRTRVSRFFAPVPWFIRVAMALAATGVIAVAALWGTGAFVPPVYTQAWCGQVEQIMHPVGKWTFDAFMGRLQAAEAADAPVGQLVSDEQQADTDTAIAANDLASNEFGDIAAEMRADNAIKSDMESLNRACGIPADWHVSSIVVPSAS